MIEIIFAVSMSLMVGYLLGLVTGMEIVIRIWDKNKRRDE